MEGPGTRCRKSRELHGGSEMEHQRNLRWSGNGDRGCSRLQRGWLSGEDRGKLEESGSSFPKGRSWVWSCRWALGLEVKEHRGDPKGTVCGRDMEWSKANSKGGRVVRLGHPRTQRGTQRRDTRPSEAAEQNGSFQALRESEEAALGAPRASRPPPPNVTSTQQRPTSLPQLGQGQRRLGGRGKEPEPEPGEDPPSRRQDWVLHISFLSIGSTNCQAS